MEKDDIKQSAELKYEIKVKEKELSAILEDIEREKESGKGIAKNIELLDKQYKDKKREFAELLGYYIDLEKQIDLARHDFNESMSRNVEVMEAMEAEKASLDRDFEAIKASKSGFITGLDERTEQLEREKQLIEAERQGIGEEKTKLASEKDLVNKKLEELGTISPEISSKLEQIKLKEGFISGKESKLATRYDEIAKEESRIQSISEELDKKAEWLESKSKSLVLLEESYRKGIKANENIKLALDRERKHIESQRSALKLAIKEYENKGICLK